MNVVVADIAAHARAALRLLLEQDPSVARVRQAATYACVVRSCSEEDVNVLLVDWRLPDLDLRQLKQDRPRLRIIVLCARPEERASALAAGADAFVCKGDAPEMLLAALSSSA